MKKLFVLMLLLIEAMQGIYAQKPYAVLSVDNTTQTFYYDTNKVANGYMKVVVFGMIYGWNDQRENITTVVFDDSFINCTSISSTAFGFMATPI